VVRDHNKALESKPFGSVAAAVPVTLPDPNIVANGPWYKRQSVSRWRSHDARRRQHADPAFRNCGQQPDRRSGFAYMWHSHNEREITHHNIFPGGMLMMMLVDPRAYKIDESK